MASQYLYQSLNKDNSKIRLLDIVALENGASIRCEVQVVSLQDNPVYSALSYVWGDPSITEDILIDSSTLTVTKNLADALRHVKQHWHKYFPDRDTITLRLWTDAICINQHDLEERSHQVKLMASIYTSAELVIAWLGGGDEEISRGLKALQIISREVMDQDEAMLSTPADWGTAEPSLQWIEKYPSLWFSYLDDVDTRPVGFKDMWNGVSRFLHLPYWSRIWIFQEAALARNLLLTYGPDSIKLHYLLETLTWGEWLQSSVSDLTIPSCLSSTVYLLLFCSGTLVPNPIIVTFRKTILRPSKVLRGSEQWDPFWMISPLLRASDPRDHVYGLLGLTSCNIEPDYQKSVADVYCDLLCAWLQDEQNLIFLTFAGIMYDNTLQLPSWAPNYPAFSQAGLRGFLGHLNAHTTLFDETQERIYILDSSLFVIGAAIGSITRTARAFNDNPFRNSQMLDYCRDFISRNPTYITGIPPLQAIFRVFWENEDTNNDQTTLLRALAFLQLTFFPDLETPYKGHFSIFEPSSGDEFPEFFEKWFFPNCEFITCGLPNPATEDLWSHQGMHYARIETYRQLNVKALQFIETEYGYLGLASTKSEIGDLVCIVKGYSSPVVLRKVNGHYIHVGTCWVLGLKDRETAALKKAKVERFEIR